MISKNINELNNATTGCDDLSHRVNSRGIWDKGDNSVLSYSLPLLQLQMLVVFTTAEASHFLFKHIGLSRFLSQIFVSYFFLFLSGVKTDVSVVFNAGKKSFIIGILSVMMSLLVGSLVQSQLSEHMLLSNEDNFTLGIMTAADSTTSLIVVAMFLQDLKILNSELGQLALSSGLVSEIFSLAIRMVINVTRLTRRESVRSGLMAVASTIAYIFILVFAIRPTLLWMIKQTPEGRPVKRTHIYAILVMVLGLGWIITTFGQFMFMTVFLFGLITPDGPPLGSALVDKLDSFVSGVFLPLYVIITVMKIDLSIVNLPMVKASQIIFLACFLGKMAACLTAPLYCKMPLTDAVAIALLLSCKGITEVAYYSILKDLNVFPKDIFSALVITIMITTSLGHVLVKYLYDPSRKYAGYENRSIMHKKTAELPILACVHESYNIPSIITLINASNPTKEEPINLYVLHLLNLTARASPVFISHQLQKNKSSNHPYSENVILSFDNFQEMNLDTITVSTFTTISPTDLMHEDICNLALKKQTSLIILPFHQRWTRDGYVQSEYIIRRHLNRTVLERAPCSVGVLIDRTQTKGRHQEPICRVCMIFIGGKDDREALTLAKRISKHSEVQLTVLRLLSSSKNQELDWESVFDTEELKYVKQRHDDHQSSMTYIEKVVNNGEDTAALVQSLKNEYDLYIVGRRYGIETRQTSWLSEWSEFPELGDLGDLLASRDINIQALILVVQQQILAI